MAACKKDRKKDMLHLVCAHVYMCMHARACACACVCVCVH